MNNPYVALLILVMSLVTIFLRFLPFIIFSGQKEIPKTILYLGDVLPSAAIGMLVIYCLRDLNFTVSPYGWKTVMASLIVIIAHRMKRNSIISILAGTMAYMLLLSVP